MSDDASPPVRLPLEDLTVLVTRPRGQAETLSRRLERAGASVVARPTIRIEPMEDPGPLAREIRRLDRYDWLLLTSVNGVHHFVCALERGGVVPADLSLRTAAIGPATARAMKRAGIPAEVVPRGYRAEELARSIVAACTARGPTSRRASSRPMDRLRVLLPRAAEARPVLPRLLREAGAEVSEVPAYRTVPEHDQREALRELLEAPGLDWITFTSSSTARCLVELVGARTAGARVAAIGPITAETAERLGFRVSVVARRHTSKGLVQALIRTVTRRTGSSASHR